MGKTPPATLRSLRALDAAPEKKMTYRDFRKATGVKSRAYYPLVTRMEDANLIAHWGDLSRNVGYTLTFAGMQALLNV